MNWKRWALVGLALFVLGDIIVMMFLGMKAKAIIQQAVARADSIAAHAAFTEDSVKDLSRLRDIETKFWKDSATAAGNAAAKVDTVIHTVRATLPGATQADSFRTYQRLADDLYPKQIFHLQVQHVADLHQISILTEDRDSWMRKSADNLRDLEALRQNTHVVANAAKRQVNLWFLHIPTDVALVASGLVSGAAACAAFC